VSPTPARASLPYGRHVVEDDDVAAVVEVLRGDWLTTGPAVEALEEAFAAAVGAPHAVAVNSGTAALHLAALAAGLGPGRTAVVPAVTFLATANAVRYCGADVVFADVDPDTGLTGPAQLEAAVARAGGRADAVFPVHLGGQCADPAGIAAVAAAAGAVVVEDACHALGTVVDGAPVGSCAASRMATFSLHPVKTVAAGEGGVVTARDAADAARLRAMRSHGMVRDAAGFSDPAMGLAPDGTPNPWYYEMPEPGFNYRLSDVNCALALSQVRKLDRFVARRAALAARYEAALAPLAPLVRPVPRTRADRVGWHLMAVLVDFEALGTDRASVMRRLAARGIGTQVHYVPVPRQPYYRRLYGDPALPGADRYYARTLSLPLFPAMDEGDVDRVAAELASLVEECTRR